VRSAQERFVGRIIVVTGAAQGIGEAVTRRLASEGAVVYAIDRKADRLARLAEDRSLPPGAIRPVPLDITDHASVEAAISHIDGEHALDGLVNGAGVLFPCAFEATSPEVWERTLAVNATGAFVVSTCVARRMVRRRTGSIVTIASNAGRTPRLNMAAYCASKAAVTMMTKCMGLELGPSGIRCNIVSPGSTDTPMLRELAGRGDGWMRPLIQGDLAAFRAGIPLGKIASPSEVASAVVFLLSAEANHITLHDLVVDGGATFA
jgi:2,3-dihydro-2,3-dihydroxybenzoate dehydrogenase